MKIDRLQTFIVSVPYLHAEVSSRIHRGGVTDVIVKLTTDDGAVGWGDLARAPAAPGAARTGRQATLRARRFGLAGP